MTQSRTNLLGLVSLSKPSNSWSHFNNDNIECLVLVFADNWLAERKGWEVDVHYIIPFSVNYISK